MMAAILRALLGARGDVPPAAELAVVRASCQRGAVVRHVREHHRRDDEEDEEPLEVQGHPLLRVDDAVVEEDADPDEDEDRRDVLQEVVDRPERLPRPKNQRLNPG
jgi:hypothetical protein